MLPNSNIRVLDVGFAVEFRFVFQKIEGTSRLRHLRQRQFIECLDRHTDALSRGNSFSQDLVGYISRLNVFENITHTINL